MGFSEVLGEYRKKLEIEHEGQTRVVEEYVETLPDQATMLFCLKNLKRDQTRDIRLLDDIQAAFEKAAEADQEASHSVPPAGAKPPSPVFRSKASTPNPVRNRSRSPSPSASPAATPIP